MTRQEELVQAARKEYPEWEEAQCHYIDGAHYADSHPRWISVEDELPPKDEAYLAYWQHLGVTKYRYVKAGAKVSRFFSEHVTHWMPLPQAPKEGGEIMERLTVEWQDPCNNHREKIKVLLYEKGMTSKEIVERLCDVYKNEHVDLETLLYWAIQIGYNK